MSALRVDVCPFACGAAVGRRGVVAAALEVVVFSLAGEDPLPLPDQKSNALEGSGASDRSSHGYCSDIVNRAR